MSNDYRLAAQAREASGDKQPKDDGNRSRTVIEPAPDELVPKKENPLSPGVILRGNGQHIDRNIIDPFDKNYAKRPGAKPPIRTA